MRHPLPAAALAALAWIGAAPGKPQAMETGLPATMTVQVTSIRAGKPGRQILAKVRPGDRVLLRDEEGLPPPGAAGARGTQPGGALPGVIATVTPAVRGGRLYLDVAATVRDAGPGVAFPATRERTYEGTVEPAFAGGEWRVIQPVGETYALAILARPLGAAADAPLLPASAKPRGR